MADVAVNTLPTESSPAAADTVLTVKDVDGSLVRVALSAIKSLFGVPTASSSTPADLGTAAAGSSSDFARADHVHAKPTYSKSDVGLGNVDNVRQYSENNPPPYPVTSVNGQAGTVVLDADDVGAEPAVIEVTISTSGAVTQALDAGTIYHFTGNLTSLTVTASNATTGKYQFDFISGATVPTLTVPSSWVMPDNFMVEPSARYSLTVENGYCSLKKWSDSHSPFIYLDSEAGDFVMNSSGITSDGKVYANVGSEIIAVSIGGKLKNQLANNIWLKICDISANAKALMGSTYVESYITVGSGKVAQCAFNTWESASEIKFKNNTGAALAANTVLVGTLFIMRTL